MTKTWRWPLMFSGLALLSQAFSLPSPVKDAATRAWTPGFKLILPKVYVVFAPLFGFADRLTLMSYHEGIVFLVYLLAALFLLFSNRKAAIILSLFTVIVVWTALIPRPMARLVAQDPDILLIDFHSHSAVSHDGRASFTPEANMRWHQDQGFNAAFITDHNRIDSSQKAKELSRAQWQETGYRSLEGEEISLYKTHLVVLGVHQRIDNKPYDSDPMKVQGFIADMNQRKLPVIASLPEYWWYHWYRSPIGTIEDFLRWDVNGFEIVNSAPRALDFPPNYRKVIMRLCQKNNLFVTGISDNHGYGYATAAWNAVRLPQWQVMDPDELEKAVLNHLRAEGFNAVQVLERARYNPRNIVGLLLSPVIIAGVYWRSLQGAEAISWVIWIWLAFGLQRLFSKRQKLELSTLRNL